VRAERVETMKTTSTSLQAKLDQLVELIDKDNREAFVAAFVPLDLTKEESSG
jgi:hypothetical protein